MTLSLKLPQFYPPFLAIRSSPSNSFLPLHLPLCLVVSLDDASLVRPLVLPPPCLLPLETILPLHSLEATPVDRFLLDTSSGSRQPFS